MACVRLTQYLILMALEILVNSQIHGLPSSSSDTIVDHGIQLFTVPQLQILR
jgi:hypothetical protein